MRQPMALLSLFSVCATSALRIPSPHMWPSQQSTKSIICHHALFLAPPRRPPTASRHRRCHPITANAATGDADSDGQTGGRLFGKRGVAVALSYATISAIWYLLGMATVLLGSAPSPGDGTKAIRRVVRRLAVAWAVTFSASQVTTPWRAGGAVALSPLMKRLIASGPRASLRAFVYVLALALFFGGGVVALGLRELALVGPS